MILINKFDEDYEYLAQFEGIKSCTWDVFGDERQIQRAIKFETMAYGYYWEIEDIYGVDFARWKNGEIRWEDIKEDEIDD